MRSILLQAASRKGRRTSASSHGAFKEGPDLFIKGQEGREEFKSLKKKKTPDQTGDFTSASSQVFFSRGSNSSDVLCAPCWCLSLLFFYRSSLSIFAFTEPPRITQMKSYQTSKHITESNGVITTSPECPPRRC